MNAPLLPCLEVQPQSPVRYSVIWLHGLGANGHDFEPIVPYLKLDDAWGVRFVFPHAPSIPVTVNGGMVMPAWYDIDALGGQGRDDVEGIERSADQVRALMDRERDAGLDDEHIILAGFSQGGAVALHTALRSPRPLGGLMALSTYLVLEDRVEAEATAAGRSLNAFVAHGRMDPMVPFQGGRRAAETLEALGATVEWHEYPMQHEVCPREIEDIGNWLRSVVRP